MSRRAGVLTLRGLKIREGKAREAAERRTFLAILQGAGLPLPVPQFTLPGSEREWTFDYAWPDRHIALEVQGGLFARLAHSSPMGVGRDLNKYNDAARLGWRVIYCVPGATEVARYRKRKDGTRGGLEFWLPALINLSIVRFLKPYLEAGS